jgi:radical SAM protein with 4Fe4S-binding SPASM domain
MGVEEELIIPEIEKIARNYGKLHYLALSGGEPFVRKDIEPLCQAFIDHCETAVIDIPSNFFYTETMIQTIEPLVDQNPEVKVDLQLSIDHIGKAHDESRNVKNLYDRALVSFRALSKIREQHPNLTLKVNIVYLEKNRNDIRYIVSELSKIISFDRLQISYPNILVPKEWTSESPAVKNVENFINVEHQTLQGRSLRNKYDLYTLGMRSVKGIYHRLLAEAVQNTRTVGSYCEAGRHIVVINEKGDVFPCEPLWEPIGNLRECNYDMKAILRSDRYQHFRHEHLGPNKCNCTWGCAIHSSISVRPKYFPELGVNAVKLFFNR